MTTISKNRAASYLEWEKMHYLLRKLDKDGNYKFELLIAIGSYTGLRISDILALRWSDIINRSHLEVIEKKTRKYRKIRLNPELIEIVERLYRKMVVLDDDEFLFVNRFGTQPMSVQYVNRRLKEIFKHYKIRIPNVSTHTFRKTLGRRVWENNNYSERSLIMLGELFNHSSVKTTSKPGD